MATPGRRLVSVVQISHQADPQFGGRVGSVSRTFGCLSASQHETSTRLQEATTRHASGFAQTFHMDQCDTTIGQFIAALDETG